MSLRLWLALEGFGDFERVLCRLGATLESLRDDRFRLLIMSPPCVAIAAKALIGKDAAVLLASIASDIEPLVGESLFLC